MFSDSAQVNLDLGQSLYRVFHIRNLRLQGFDSEVIKLLVPLEILSPVGFDLIHLVAKGFDLVRDAVGVPQDPTTGEQNDKQRSDVYDCG